MQGQHKLMLTNQQTSYFNKTSQLQRSNEFYSVDILKTNEYMSKKQVTEQHFFKNRQLVNSTDQITIKVNITKKYSRHND